MGTGTAVTALTEAITAAKMNLKLESVVNADVEAGAAIAYSKLATLASARLIVGSAGGVATAVDVTGDVTISNAGVTAIEALVIVNADVSASAAIAWAKMAALTSAHILVGSAANVATDVDMTGDVTITNAGVTAIGATKVTEAMLAASSGTGLGVLRVARARYSFAVDGGAQGLITPVSNATIPDNAIIVGGQINSTTAATSGGAATISVGTSAGSSATSLLGVTAVASFSADARINSVATFAAAVKMSAAGSITLTVATADLTAGIIEVTVLYFVAQA